MPVEIEARLHRLEDLEAIRALIARYGPLADAGRSAQVADLWTTDGEYEIAGFGHAHGRERIAAMIDSPVHRGLMAEGCAHVLSAPAITLAGDRADATNHSFVLRRDGENWNAWRVSANRWELVRTAEGWRVARRVNRPLDGNSDALALLAEA